MTTLKANKDNATFIGKAIEQGVGEQDWYQYQPVVKSKLSEIIVDALASTNTSLVADLAASYPDIFPANGDTVYVRETGSDVVKSHVVSDVTDTVENGAWNVSTASFVQSFSVAGEETTPRGLFFKPDGTKMYVVGDSGDNVNEYNLSTAWNVSTASFLQSFSVAGQEISSTGLLFKPDGTKMYVVGAAGKDVNEYNLSTAWNVSTASYVQNFSVSAQDANPAGLFFKTDGTKMYMVGLAGGNVNEYNLSTAWNISTASFLQSFSVAGQDANSTGLSFKPDGTKMYVVGLAGDSVYEYNLSTAWNISTASFLQSFSVAGQDANSTGLSFKPDGTKMYVVGLAGDSVYEYNLPSQLTLDISSLGLSAAPSHAMLAHTPSVQVSAEATADRCLTEDYMLTNFSSASTTECSGDLRTGMGQTVFAGDTVILDVLGSPTEVTVLTASFTAPTLTLTFAAQADIPTSCTIPNRASVIPPESKLYLSDGNLQTTYQTTVKPLTRAIQYRLGADYATEINQLNVNLWKDG